MACLLIQFSPYLVAGEKENSIINKAVKAYGGEKLRQLQSLKYTDNLEHFFQMQSGHSAQGAMTMHFSNYQIEINLDLVNKRKEFKQATTRLIGNHGRENLTTTHRVFVEDKGFIVDHCLKQYQFVPWVNFNNADAGYSQMLDPLIIKQLDQDRDKSRLNDKAYIQGQAHDVLTINEGKKQEYTLYLNQGNGHLSRMIKMRGEQLRSYDFLQHEQAQGITWAKQMFVSTAEQPIYHTDSRQLSFNSLKKSDFNTPTGYQLVKQAQAVDVSKLTIRQLAKDVYFVGKGWGYTLFIDAGEHYISVGAWGEMDNSNAWQQGLDLLRQTTGNNKPVAQHVVTHHHTDHMSALKDIVKLGANLVIHPSSIAGVKKHLKQPLVNDRLLPIEDTGYLANGKVMIFDVPISHASHNLVVYLPEQKLLFTEDMFGSSYQTELESPNNWPSKDSYQRLEVLTDKVKQLNLEVEQYVSSHHGRVLTQADIDKALKLSCPANDELTKRLYGYH